MIYILANINLFYEVYATQDFILKYGSVKCSQSLESLTQLFNRVGASRIIITVSRNKTRDIVTNLFMATYSINCILTHSANMLLANKILLNE